MDITQLQRMGLYTPNPLIKKTVTIKFYPLLDESKDADPNGPRSETLTEATVDFWIRKFTASDRIATGHLAQTDPDSATYLAIQRGVFREDGTPVFASLDEARSMDLGIYAPVMIAIKEINGEFAKKSRPRTNGGTRSPSPSGAGQSVNGRKSSPKRKPNPGSSSPTSTAP